MRRFQGGRAASISVRGRFSAACRELRCRDLVAIAERSPAAQRARWKVSLGAMIKRCRTLGIITDEPEQRLWKHYGARGWRKAEPLDDTLATEVPRLLERSIRLLNRRACPHA